MKIAVLWYGRIDDGPGRHIIQTAKSLEKLGHQIDIYWRHLVNTNNINSFLIKTSSIPHINRYQFEFAMINKLKLLEKYDIVNGQILGMSFGLYKKIKKLKVPLVITSHGAISYSEYLRLFPALPSLKEKLVRYFFWPFSTYMAKCSMKLADKVFAVGTTNAKEIQRMGISDDKITIVYNGVDIPPVGNLKKQAIEEFKRELGVENDLIVLFFGRLHSQKGPLYLVKAIPHVLKEINAKFIFVGTGPQETIAKELAKKFGVEDHVLFVGYVPEIYKPYYFSICDVFAFPSIYEGFPLVTMEAAAYAKPIVAFDIPQVSEFITDGKYGLLVKIGDYKTLADKIVYLLENLDVAKRIGVNSKKSVEKKYSWMAVAKRIEKAFKRLI